LAALTEFNEIILREAFCAGLPVIDLRLIRTSIPTTRTFLPSRHRSLAVPTIARVVAEVSTTHNFFPDLLLVTGTE